MGVESSLREIRVNFPFGDVSIKAIDASHGVFMRSFPRHMHSFYELHYITGGQGRLILDDAEYELSKGNLFLIAPKVHHAQLTDINNCMEEYCFSFEVQQKRAKGDDTISRFFADCDFYLCGDSRGMEAAFIELEMELKNRELGYMIAIQSLLERILLLTVRNFLYHTSEIQVLRTVPDDRRSLLMDEAFLYAYQTLTLEGLADILNLSPRHTERLIYEKYGTSFAKLRMQSRLNAAINMIGNKEKRLSEIAEKCGFSSYNHFSREFKKAYGMSPSEYQKVDMSNGGKRE